VRWTGARQTLLPFAVAANSVPIVAFAPLANNWFGLQSPLSTMVIAAVIVFFPVMINTLRGLTLVDASALELMRSYAARERTVLWKLRIPNALPFLFTALKIATTLSLIGAVVAEYFGAPRASLGQYIVQQAAYFGFARSWAAIIFACAIGIGMYLVILALERVAMPWHASMRGTDRPV
jgi:NitT/TauT family transport system permease protein